MGLFSFGRDSGKAPQTPIAPAQEQANAAELAQNLRALGITIDNGQITVRGDTVTITGTPAGNVLSGPITLDQLRQQMRGAPTRSRADCAADGNRDSKSCN